MEIGGQDIIVTTVLEKKDQVKAIHDIIKDVWPDIVWEIADKDKWGNKDEIPPPEEIFFYENQKWADSWDENGCTDENDQHMIYLLPGDSQFTLVMAVELSDILKLIVSKIRFSTEKKKLYSSVLEMVEDTGDKKFVKKFKKLLKQKDTIGFKLTKKQEKKLAKWKKEKDLNKHKSAIGGRFTYYFTPTTIGLVAKVIDEVDGDELDLTDYEMW